MNLSKYLVVIVIGLLMQVCIYFGFFDPLLLTQKSRIFANLFLLFILACILLYLSSLHHPYSFAQKLSPLIGIFFIFFTLSIPSLLLLQLGKVIPTLAKNQSYFIFGFFALGCVITLYAIYQAYAPAKVYTHTLTLPNLKIPLKILQLSDLHIGGSYISSKTLQNLISQSNALTPDVIVLTGDIVDAPSQKVIQEIRLLSNLKAPYGVFYVLGNHEYFYDTAQIIQELKQLNINVLINENQTLIYDTQPILNIAGIADLSGKNHPLYAPNLSQIIKELNPIAPSILLSHQPKIIKSLPSPSPFSLVLSGHTHGGQIFPFNLFVPLQQPAIKGFKALQDTLLYVNQGSGFWGIPMRLGSECEITLFKLQANDI